MNHKTRIQSRKSKKAANAEDRRIAAAWLAGQERRFAGVRIDVITVMIPSAGAARVEHLRGVG